MTKRTLLASMALGLLVALPGTAAAQDLASQLVGVWKRTSLVQKELATGMMKKPYGEIPGGTAFFTLNGHFASILVPESRKPAGQTMTDAERISLFSTAFFGSGTYKVEGSTVILKYNTSSNPAWTGTERRAEMQVSGKMLTWTSPPYMSMDGKELVAIQTLERME